MNGAAPGVTGLSMELSTPKDARAILWFGWVAFAVSVVSLLVRQDLRLYFNADYCYAPALIQDLFAMGGHLSEWDFPPAPYFFPDVLVYALWYAVLGNPGLALAAAGATFLAVFVAGWAMVARHLAETDERALAGQGLVFLAGALFCTMDSFREAALSSLTITSHFGVASLAPYMVLLAMTLLDASPGQPRRKLRMALFGGILALLVLSDTLAVAQIVLPLLAAAGAMMVRAGPSRRRGWSVVAVLCASVVAGFAILRQTDRVTSVAYLQLAFSPAYTALAAEYALEWIRSCVREQTLSVALAIAAGVGLTAAVLEAGWRVLRGEDASARSVVVPVFAVAAVVGTAAGIVLTGRWTARYVFPMTLGLVFAAPALLAALKAGARAVGGARFVLVAAYAVTIALNCGHLSRIGDLARYVDSAPEWVRELDREAGRLGLNCGVTDYWLARPVMLFSSSGIRMIPSRTDLMPQDWISNRKWCDRFEPQFVYCTTNECVSDRIRERDVVAKFGVPEKRQVIGDMALLVYRPTGGRIDPRPGRESAAFFRDWWRKHPARVRFTKAGDAATFNVADLIGEKSATLRAPKPPVGALAFWVLRTLPRGEYAVRVAYEAAPGDKRMSPGAWQAMRVAKDKAEVIGGGMLRYGTNAVEGTFVVDRDSQVDLRIFYSGGGILTTHRLDLERRR